MSAIPVLNKRYFLPDLADIIFIGLLYLMLRLRPEMIFTDGSTGWHILTGQYILQHHDVPHIDILSYTFASKPWVAYEWLSDLIMSCLVNLGGFNLLAVAIASAIAFLFFLLYQRCRKNGCNFLLAVFLTITGALVSSVHWLARPHLFTFFGLFIFASQLDNYYHGTISAKKLAIFLTLYMLLWANCHPGFIFGLALIGLYILCILVEYLLLKKDDLAIHRKVEQAYSLSLILILNTVASLCNPYGINLHAYIGNYVFNHHHTMTVITEFLSPVFHGEIQPTLLELLFAALIIGLAISKLRITFPDLLIYLIFTHLSLSAQRNMSLYVIAALPIIARLYSQTIFNSGAELYQALKKPWRTLINKLETLNKDFTEKEQLCSFHLLPIITVSALILISLHGGKAFAIEVVHSDFDTNSTPQQTLIAIKQLDLDPTQGMALDNWAGIIKYKLDYPVFIDDRADFYEEEFYAQYGELIQASPGWQKILDNNHINWVLLPKDNRLIAELKESNDWKLAAEDRASTLMLRKVKTK